MARCLLIERAAEVDEEFLIEEVEDYSMKTITRTALQASVIAGAAFVLAAISTMPTARRAFAQDTPAPEASADAESPDALPINIEGSWSGSINDDSLGAGDVSFSISQKNRKINGGWSATFNTFSVLGDFKGHVTSKKATFVLTSANFENKSCKAKFTPSEVSGTEITGSYKYVNCGKQFKHDGGGTIDVTPTPTM
jgi:hypothetical protein